MSLVLESPLYIYRQNLAWCCGLFLVLYVNALLSSWGDITSMAEGSEHKRALFDLVSDGNRRHSTIGVTPLGVSGRKGSGTQRRVMHISLWVKNGHGYGWARKMSYVCELNTNVLTTLVKVLTIHTRLYLSEFEGKYQRIHFNSNVSWFVQGMDTGLQRWRFCEGDWHVQQPTVLHQTLLLLRNNKQTKVAPERTPKHMLKCTHTRSVASVWYVQTFSGCLVNAIFWIAICLNSPRDTQTSSSYWCHTHCTYTSVGWVCQRALEAVDGYKLWILPIWKMRLRSTFL